MEVKDTLVPEGIREANLKRKLLLKGEKINLQFSKKERDYLLEEAGFTDEESEIFIFRSRGFTVFRIAMEMTERHGKEFPSGEYSVSKVEARIRSIKHKILKVI